MKQVGVFKKVSKLGSQTQKLLLKMTWLFYVSITRMS